MSHNPNTLINRNGIVKTLAEWDKPIVEEPIIEPVVETPIVELPPIEEGESEIGVKSRGRRKKR